MSYANNSWHVRLSGPGSGLVEVTVLCSWTRQFTIAVPLSAQENKLLAQPKKSPGKEVGVVNILIYAEQSVYKIDHVITMYWSCKNHGRIKYVELRSIKLGCRGIGNLRWTSIPSGVGWGGGRVEIPMDLQWRCGDFGPIANSLLAEKWLIKTKELNRNQSKQL